MLRLPPSPPLRGPSPARGEGRSRQRGQTIVMIALMMTGILGLATYAWLNGATQSVLDGINQATVETLNLVVTGRQGGHQEQQY